MSGLNFLMSLSMWQVLLMFVCTYGIYLAVEYKVYKDVQKVRKEEEDRVSNLPIDERILFKLNKIISDESCSLYNCNASKGNKKLELNLNLYKNYRVNEDFVTGFKALESIYASEPHYKGDKIIKVLKLLPELDEKFELYKINLLVGVMDDYGYASAKVLHSFLLTGEDLSRFNWGKIDLYNLENVSNKNKNLVRG